MPVHTLFAPEPENGSPAWLPRPEVIRRLRAEFDSVEIDAENGQSEAFDLLSKLVALNAPQQSITALQATYQDAFRAFVSDHEDEYNAISFLFIPCSSIVIVHAKDQSHYVRRCAQALGYRIEVTN